MVDAVAIRPIFSVAMARAPNVETGSSQVLAAWATSSFTTSVSARKIESNNQRSAVFAASMKYEMSVKAFGDDLGWRQDAS